VAHACNLASQRKKAERSWFEASPEQVTYRTLSQKNSSQIKKAGGVDQGIDPRTTKNK
jgi:hypothetical protein